MVGPWCPFAVLCCMLSQPVSPPRGCARPSVPLMGAPTYVCAHRYTWCSFRLGTSTRCSPMLTAGRCSSPTTTLSAAARPACGRCDPKEEGNVAAGLFPPCHFPYPVLPYCHYSVTQRFTVVTGPRRVLVMNSAHPSPLLLLSLSLSLFLRTIQFHSVYTVRCCQFPEIRVSRRARGRFFPVPVRLRGCWRSAATEMLVLCSRPLGHVAAP